MHRIKAVLCSKFYKNHYMITTVQMFWHSAQTNKSTKVFIVRSENTSKFQN